MLGNLFSLAALTFLLAMPFGAVAQDGDKGLDAFKEFLKKAHAKKKWQIGPKQIMSDEFKKAFGGQQEFYFVFSTPPLPPGANIPEAIQAYEARVKDYRDNYVSVTVRVDSAGKVFPLAKVADYNETLMPVTNGEDVKTATAVVLSLFGSRQVSPGLVQAKEVTVTKTDQGWYGAVDRQHHFQGTVGFNNKGQVTTITKNYTGPLPP